MRQSSLTRHLSTSSLVRALAMSQSSIQTTTNEPDLANNPIEEDHMITTRAVNRKRDLRDHDQNLGEIVSVDEESINTKSSQPFVYSLTKEGRIPINHEEQASFSNGSHIITNITNVSDIEHILSNQHLDYVRKLGSCHVPQLRVVPLQNKHPLRMYYPHCALLHRCDASTGCCESDQFTCEPKTENKVLLPFLSIELKGSGKQERKVEWLTFTNHTECKCQNILSNRKRPRSMHQETEIIK